jgi:hypothetical protein
VRAVQGLWLKLMLTFIVGSLFWAMPASAQTAPPLVPPSPAVKGYWYTAGADGEQFATPQAACRRQHEVYNPVALLQDPIRVSFIAYKCQWLKREGGNTTLPSLVKYYCPSGAVLPSLVCVTDAELAPEVNCCTQG